MAIMKVDGVDGNMTNSDEVHNDRLVVNIFPLSGYYFTSKPPPPAAAPAAAAASNSEAHRIRTCVHAVILVELFKHPHLLLLQSKNCIYTLPGGRLRPAESDVDGLKRKLLTKLSADDDNNRTQWEVSECIGTWWKSDFETLPYPYLPSSARTAKECIKLYLVKLPSSQDFIVPKNFKLLAVPMCQLHENRKTYGSIIAGIPQLLSRFSINMFMDANDRSGGTICYKFDVTKMQIFLNISGVFAGLSSLRFMPPQDNIDKIKHGMIHWMS